MRELDNVKLKEEIKELSEKGIHKNYLGIIVKIKGEACTVCFYNRKNFGEYAFAEVNKKHLDFVIRADEKILLEMEEFFANVKKEKYMKLTECDVKEYDVAELIVDKPKYTIEGLKKGDRGCVVASYAIEGKWQIIFTERGTGKDIADILVDREDFKIVEKF